MDSGNFTRCKPVGGNSQAVNKGSAMAKDSRCCLRNEVSAKVILKQK